MLKYVFWSRCVTCVQDYYITYVNFKIVMCSGQARNPKPEGPTGFLANPKKPEPDIPGPRPEICMYKMEKWYLSS